MTMTAAALDKPTHPKSEPMVHIVDDDWPLCQSLANFLSDHGYAIRTYPTAENFLERYQPGGPACLVLDVRMPGASGLELQERLRALDINLPIVFLTAFGDVPMSVRAMRGGAIHFLEKPFDERMLLDAVNEAMELASRSYAEDGEKHELMDRLGRLTRREREVFELVITGRPNKQIAHDLGISEHTTKIHRGRVMHKMQADSVAALVLMATRLGFEPEEFSDGE